MYYFNVTGLANVHVPCWSREGKTGGVWGKLRERGGQGTSVQLVVSRGVRVAVIRGESTVCGSCVVLTLGQPLQRWFTIRPAHGQLIVFFVWRRQLLHGTPQPRPYHQDTGGENRGQNSAGNGQRWDGQGKGWGHRGRGSNDGVCVVACRRGGAAGAGVRLGRGGDVTPRCKG